MLYDIEKCSFLQKMLLSTKVEEAAVRPPVVTIESHKYNCRPSGSLLEILLSKRAVDEL